MARKIVTWDFSRQRWLAQANTPGNGDTWEWYTRCRAPLVKMPGASGVYRPAREHLPQQYGFHIALSADQTQLYLVVIAVPKPMKIGDPAWKEYTRDSGLQFPYTVSFTNAAPLNVIYPAQNRSGMHQHTVNGGGWVSNTASVDASAYVGPNAQVLDSAQVRGNARVEDFAVVRNNAQVRDNAVVSGRAMVSGNAKVRDWATVSGYSQIYENAKVIEHAICIGGGASNFNRVFGSAVLKGNAFVYTLSSFSGSLITDGDTANGGTGDHGVHFGWQWGVNTSIFTGLADNAYQYSGLTFERDNSAFALDEFGINHGYLLNGCRTTKDSGTSVRGGRVLALNGTNQYVELHNSVNDFKQMTVALWFKRTGTTANQCLWSMGDGCSRIMSLTANESGGLRFLITDGSTSHVLNAPVSDLNAWTHAAVVFSGSTATLYLNGTAAASPVVVSIYPDGLNAPSMENANYLGRDDSGNYFQGSVDEFRVFNKGLSAAEITALYGTAAPAAIAVAADTTAPTPNAAAWLVAPTANGDHSVTMSATPGTDASGWVEYYFSCVSFREQGARPANMWAASL